MVPWSSLEGVVAVPVVVAARPESPATPRQIDDPARRGPNRVEDVGDDWRSLLLGAPPGQR